MVCHRRLRLRGFGQHLDDEAARRGRFSPSATEPNEIIETILFR